MLMDYIEESDGRPLAQLWTELDAGRERRQNFFRDLSRIMLDFARVEFPRICSPTISNDGVVEFRNRPLTFRLQQMENKGISIPLERCTTYLTTDSYISGLLSCHEARVRQQRNSIRDRANGERKSAVLASLKTLSTRFSSPDLRDGPFIFMLTDIHPNNIFVDDEWHIQYLIDLEWACVRPVEMLLPPVWFTGRRVDQLPEGPCLAEYHKILQEYLDAMEKETLLTPHFNETAGLINKLMRSTLSSGRFWYYQALDNPKVSYNLFTQHIWPLLSSGQEAEDFSAFIKGQAVSFDQQVDKVMESRLEEREQYLAELRAAFDVTNRAVGKRGCAGGAPAR
jgi:hypothetical protein